MSGAAPNPAARPSIPTFDLVILEALDEMREAYRQREEWRAKLANARTSTERGAAVAGVNRWNSRAIGAERRVREAVLASVKT